MEGSLEKVRPFPDAARETVLALTMSRSIIRNVLRASSSIFYLYFLWLLPMAWTWSLEEPLRGYFSRFVVRYTITHLAVEKSY